MAKRLWDKGEVTNEQVLAYTVGEDPVLDLEIARWDAVASAAHAKMLCSVGILDVSECRKVVQVLKEVAALQAEGKFTIPIELEDCHTAIEAFLVERLGDSGKKINTGRSRNDQVITAVRLYLRNQTLVTLQHLLDAAEKFSTRFDELAAVPLPGYTHMRPAMPSSVGMWLHAFYETLLEHIRDGLRFLQSVDQNPLGAASGFGVPLRLDRALTAKLLGFSRVQRSPVDVQNSRGRYEIKFTAWLSEIAASLEKLAWDLILYSSEEFGYFSLPLELTTGSSIMPQKRNPDVMELTRARAGRVRAAQLELLLVASKLPSNYHRDFQLLKAPLFRAAAEVAQMLPICGLVIERFAVNKARLEEVQTPELYATYHVYRQVREGVPFRDAYVKTHQAIKDGSIDPAELKPDFALVQENVAVSMSEARQEIEELGVMVGEVAASLRAVEERVFEGTACA